jgi:hypothetical protein
MWRAALLACAASGQSVSDQLYDLTVVSFEMLTRRRVFPRNFGGEGRCGAASIDVIPVSRAEISLHQGLHLATFRSPFHCLAQQDQRAFNAMFQGGRYKVRSRGEMGIEGAMCQAGIRHQLADADSGQPVLAETFRRAPHDFLARCLLLVSPTVCHDTLLDGRRQPDRGSGRRRQ